MSKKVKGGAPASNKAVQALYGIAEEIYDELDHGQVPKMKIPLRTKANIRFDSKHSVWKYGSLTGVRSAKKLKGALMLLRTMYVLEFIQDMIDTAKSSTLREMYYISEGWDVAKFHSQDESNLLAEDLEVITQLLREEPGDVIITAVGDMIFNEQISRLSDPVHQQLFRLMQEADIAYGNLEFSMNSHPEAQRPFYNFRTDPEFVWELAAIGINMVSMANNHALDFGLEGLKDCLKALDRAQITHAGAGLTLAGAREPGTMRVQSQKTEFALLSYMRYWTQKYRCGDANGPCLATINPATILVAKEAGKVEAVEGPLEGDVKAMEDDVVMAKRHNDVVMVALHNHDVSHHRAYGIQDTTPPNEEIMYHRAIDAGADGTLQVTPYYNRPSQAGLIKHFTAVADLGLPTVLVQEGGYLSDDLGRNLVQFLSGFEGRG